MSKLITEVHTSDGNFTAKVYKTTDMRYVAEYYKGGQKFADVAAMDEKTIREYVSDWISKLEVLNG